MTGHLTIALIVLGILVGCGRKTEAERQEAALEGGTGAKAQVERTRSNETVVLTEDTTETTIVSGKEVTAPATYPADGFIPAHAQLKTSVSQGTNMTIVYVIPGPLAAALSTRPKRCVIAAGWRTVLRRSTPDRPSLRTARDGRASVSSLSKSPTADLR